MPRDDRVYRTVFPRSTTRYVNGELYLTFPSPDRHIDFNIDAVFYQSDGSVVARRAAGGFVNEHWERGSGYWVFGEGSAQPPHWKAGLYRVDLSVEGKLIASEEFEIVDRQIPASGPFLELRDGLPWARQPLGLDEKNALLALSSMMETDPALAAQVASLPWMRQDLTLEGRNALQALDILANANVDLAKRVAGSSWLADGVTKDGWLSLRTLASLAATDAELIGLLAGLSWLDNDKGLTVSYILKILRESPAAAGPLLGFPWLADGVDEMEADALRHLSRISGRNGDAAAAIIAMPFLKTLESRDTLALRSLNDIFGMGCQRLQGSAVLPQDKRRHYRRRHQDCCSNRRLGVPIWVSASPVGRDRRVYRGAAYRIAPYRRNAAGHQSAPKTGLRGAWTIWNTSSAPSSDSWMSPTRQITSLCFITTTRESWTERRTIVLTYFSTRTTDAVDGGPQWHPGVLAHEVAHWYWAHNG